MILYFTNRKSFAGKRAKVTSFSLDGHVKGHYSSQLFFLNVHFCPKLTFRRKKGIPFVIPNSLMRYQDSSILPNQFLFP